MNQREREYYIKQKLYGLFIAIVFTIGGLISQIGECYLFALFGVYVIFTKEHVFYYNCLIKRTRK